MANKSPRIRHYGSEAPTAGVPGHKCITFEWGHALYGGPIVAGDVCLPANVVGYSDKMIQVFGTPGSATFVIKGCGRYPDAGETQQALTGDEWFGLTDPAAGTAITFTVAGGKQILELVSQVGWTHSGGSGSESMKVLLLVHAVTGK